MGIACLVCREASEQALQLIIADSSHVSDPAKAGDVAVGPLRLALVYAVLARREQPFAAELSDDSRDLLLPQVEGGFSK
jgi:hypothetical protein